MANFPIFFDNSRPDDDTYPNFEPRVISKRLVQVEEGDYIIDRDGDIRIVTSGNKKYFPTEAFVDTINAGYFRAKYLENEDDSLEYANQCRLATKAEIIKAKSWTKSSSSYKIDSRGQLLLV